MMNKSEKSTGCYAVLDFLKKSKGVEIVFDDIFSAHVTVDVTDEVGIQHRYKISEQNKTGSKYMSVLIKDHTDGNTRVHKYYELSNNYPDDLKSVTKDYFSDEIFNQLSILHII